MIKAVIFDMDGLMINSEPLWREVALQVFKNLSVKGITAETFREGASLRIDAHVAYFCKKFNIQTGNQPKMVREIISQVSELILRKVELKPGIIEALDFFKKRSVRLALASSSPLKLIRAVLKKFKLGKYFEVVYSGEDEKYGKPNPGIYLTTAKKLKILPRNCLAIEDSLNGVLSAKKAKIKCLAVPEKENLNNDDFQIADLILPSLVEFSEKYWLKLNS